jgi:hypothetical protein
MMRMLGLQQIFEMDMFGKILGGHLAKIGLVKIISQE